MTERNNALIVVLDKDYRCYDAQDIIDAIKMVKGVQTVSANVADINSYIAYERARQDLGDKLWNVLFPKKEK